MTPGIQKLVDDMRALVVETKASKFSMNEFAATGLLLRAADVIEYGALIASAMSASGQDAEERLEAKPASATGEAGDAQ